MTQGAVVVGDRVDPKVAFGERVPSVAAGDRRVASSVTIGDRPA